MTNRREASGHVLFALQGPAGVEGLVYPALQKQYNTTLTQLHRRSLERLCEMLESNGLSMSLYD